MRVLVASVALAGVAFAVWEPLDAALGRTFIAQVVSLGLALALGVATYIGACRLLRVRELDQLLIWRRATA